MTGDEGASGPTSGGGGRRQAACEKERQKLTYRLKIMEAGLNSQVLRPLRQARNRNFTNSNRRRFLAEAQCELTIFVEQRSETDASIDDRIEALGIENVDVSDHAQADAFAARLGTTRAALVKRCECKAAIECAKLEITRIIVELADG